MEAKDIQRSIYAKNVTGKMKQVTECWEVLDRHKKTGTVTIPNPPAFKSNVRELEAPELIALCFNLPSYVVKLRGKISKMKDGPKKTEMIAKLKIKSQELEDLKAWRDEGTVKEQ